MICGYVFSTSDIRLFNKTFVSPANLLGLEQNNVQQGVVKTLAPQKILNMSILGINIIH